MKGGFDANATYAAGDIVHLNGSTAESYFELDANAAATLSNDWAVADYAVGDVVRFQGSHYSAAVIISDDPASADYDISDPKNNAKWTLLTTDLDPAAVGSVGAAVVAAGGAITARTNAIETESVIAAGATFAAAGGTYFDKSPFQAKQMEMPSVFPLPQTVERLITPVSSRILITPSTGVKPTTVPWTD